MAFCPNCGTQLEDGKRFCPNCGTQIEAPAAPPAPSFDDGPVQAAPAPEVEHEPQAAPAAADFSSKVAQINNTPDSTGDFDPNDVKNNKVFAVLAYFGILVLIPILAAKDSPYARYHANQGLTLFILDIIVIILGRIVGFLGTIGGLIVFILFIIGIVNAAQGRAKELPVIGKFRLLK